MDHAHVHQDFRSVRRELIALLRGEGGIASELGAPHLWPERLQHLIEVVFNIPGPSFIICGEERHIIYNAAFACFSGLKQHAVFGRPFLQAFPEAGAALPYYDRAFGGMPCVAADISWPLPSRSQVGTVDLELTPVTDERLKVCWLKVRVRSPGGGVIISYKAEEEEEKADPSLDAAWNLLQNSEERLRLALHVSQLAVWDWNIKTDTVIWSDEHFRMEGYEVGEVTPSFQAWQARVHPEDLASTLAAISIARDARKLYRHEFRFQHSDGTTVWTSAVGRFFYDEAGSAVRMIGIMHDITHHRHQTERQKVLVTELQHRTRNFIGLIQSLAKKTLERATSLHDFGEHFGQRLNALARVQDFIAQIEDGNPVAFDELIRAELSAHGAIGDRGQGEKIRLQGPPNVLLSANMVQTLALALHELATNATKYGALKYAADLSVTWNVQKDDISSLLYIEWVETGVPVAQNGVVRPGRGYGRELIERALPYQLGAETTYEIGQDGLRCTISMRLDDL